MGKKLGKNGEKNQEASGKNGGKKRKNWEKIRKKVGENQL